LAKFPQDCAAACLPTTGHFVILFAQIGNRTSFPPVPNAILQGTRLVKPKVLITGGAGFIGSHIATELLGAGYSVRVLDKLDEQVHHGSSRPPYLDKEIELQVGDVCNRDDIKRALNGVEMVCHMAAAVGVGQSMYEIARYTANNDLGTAILLEEVVARD